MNIAQLDTAQHILDSAAMRTNLGTNGPWKELVNFANLTTHFKHTEHAETLIMVQPITEIEWRYTPSAHSH